MWNAGNNEEGLNTITHGGRGTVCAGTALTHIHPEVLLVRLHPHCHFNPVFSPTVHPLCLFLCPFIPPLPVCLWEGIALQVLHQTHWHTLRKTQTAANMI